MKLGYALLGIAIIAAVLAYPLITESWEKSSLLQEESAKANPPAFVTVTVSVDYGGGRMKTNEVSVREGESVLSALRKSHDVDGKEYEGMGFFITAIDDVKQDDSHSWIFFIDGKPAEKAASAIKVSDGMKVEFRYLSNDEAMKLFE